MVTHSSFLTRGLWTAASGKHIHVLITTERRNTYTTIPIQFDNPLNPSSVTLYSTNTRGQWRTQRSLLNRVKPSPPNSKDQLAMILKGTHEGHIYKTVNVSRKNKTATFKADGREWEVEFDNLCVVEDHSSNGCNCEKVN